MMTTTARLDTELVHRGLARSRRRASELIAQGRVTVAGAPARKPSQPVGPHSLVEVAAGGREYVSRAAHKLEGALAALEGVAAPGPRVAGAHCVDAGASTGGFSQVLLERGAAHVVAVDVGHGQLDPAVGGDPRLTALEGVNVRDLRPGGLPGPPADLVVADLSFISLALVLEPLAGVARKGADLVVMVKPQFEVGRERLGSGGVVPDPRRREEAVRSVAEVSARLGQVRAVVPSPLPGESGNREYFLWVVVGGAPAGPAQALHAAVADAVLHDRPARVEVGR
jgi:23S rRNA (cytidine1920-2'-O)/16S rRNA (cytidine1409-2'-O)-methyltransferase